MFELFYNEVLFLFPAVMGCWRHKSVCGEAVSLAPGSPVGKETGPFRNVNPVNILQCTRWRIGGKGQCLGDSDLYLHVTYLI